MYELALFAGAGGGILGGHLCGFTCIGAVEIEEYPREIIKQRQRDGILPKFPIWDDVCTFKSDNPECTEFFKLLKKHRRKLVLSAGFPCQPYSQSGKRKGNLDERNLWPETKRCIRAIRPKYCVLENVSALLAPFNDGRPAYFGTILRDLAECGYDAKWIVLGGSVAGSCNERKRVWIVASHSNSKFMESVDFFKPQITNPEESFRWQHSRAVCKALSQDDYTRIKRDSDVVAGAMDRLKAIGNGQVPAVVKAAWEMLK